MVIDDQKSDHIAMIGDPTATIGCQKELEARDPSERVYDEVRDWMCVWVCVCVLGFLFKVVAVERESVCVWVREREREEGEEEGGCVIDSFQEIAIYFSPKILFLS